MEMHETAESAVEPPSPTVQNNEQLNSRSNELTLAANPLQKVQIERLRLNFLLSCREIKRPPPSLRCTGFKALEEIERIEVMSKVETIALKKAIEKKKKMLKLLEKNLKNYKTEFVPLTKNKHKRLKGHFKRKLDFYKRKESSEWRLWPRKSVKINEDKVARKKQARRRRNLRRIERKMKGTAERMLNDGDVRVLVDFPVPPEAIAALGKGLGFVPTPNPNIGELRLDARRVSNKITQYANRLERENPSLREVASSEETDQDSDHSLEEPFILPKSLRDPNYFQIPLQSTNPEFQSVLQHINLKTNSLKPTTGKRRIHNLSYFEEKGFKWLKDQVANEKLCVCKADKGGAILLVPPELLSKKIEEKVKNSDLYSELDTDPREMIAQEVIDAWREGKAANFLSEKECKEIVGLTEKNNKSTASRFKCGRTYFNPSLKIHKMKTEDLVPGADIPARLITCLQEGPTKRSDVYIAQKWLKDLEKDFCTDLVKDTNDALVWLEEINKRSQKSKRHFQPFTFDFDSLYDSLSKDLLLEALQYAMDTCRPDWSSDFKTWLRKLVELSVDSAIGEYHGKFYKPRRGCPTGGSLSVQIANIAVFFVLNLVLYKDKNLMSQVVDIKRFIDDGVGVHLMTSRQFKKWKSTVSSKVANYGLKIKDTDWSEPEERFEMINFLDINFSFDSRKTLQTDLYKKPTDARAYLNFSSCHPPHVFSGSVYSQALRLRRIINDDGRLAVGLDELKKDFEKCGYPSKLLKDILDKVKIKERSLEKAQKRQ